MSKENKTKDKADKIIQIMPIKNSVSIMQGYTPILGLSDKGEVYILNKDGTWVLLSDYLTEPR